MIAERGVVSKVSVKDVCERADVRRSTFYLHFNSILDMSNQLSDNYFVSLKRIIPEKIMCVEDFARFVHNYVDVCRSREAYIRPILLSSKEITAFEDLQEKIRLAVREAFVAGGRPFNLGAAAAIIIGMIATLDKIAIGRTYATYDDVEKATILISEKIFE